MAGDPGRVHPRRKRGSAPKRVANPARLWDPTSSKHPRGFCAAMPAGTSESFPYYSKAELCGIGSVYPRNHSHWADIIARGVAGIGSVPFCSVVEIQTSRTETAVLVGNEQYPGHHANLISIASPGHDPVEQPGCS